MQTPANAFASSNQSLHMQDIITKSHKRHWSNSCKNSIKFRFVKKQNKETSGSQYMYKVFLTNSNHIFGKNSIETV